MPGQGWQGGVRGAPAKLPQAPVRTAPADLRSGSNPRGVAIKAAPARTTINDHAARFVGTGANPRGTQIAPGNSRAGRTVRNVLAEVFNHQDPYHQAQIVQSVRDGKADPATAKAILSAWHSSPYASGLGLSKYLPHSKGLSLSDTADSIGKAVGLGGPSAGKGSGTGTLADVVPFGGSKGAVKLGKNLASDAVNLGPQTVEGLYGMGKEVAGGHIGNALGDLFDPYIRTIEHPVQSFYNHPGDTLLQAAGPEAAVGRFAGAVARSGALGEGAADAAATARAPLRLGPDVAGAESPLQEARSYSPNLITKGAQRAREGVLRKRGIDPDVARPKPTAMPKWMANSLNVGLEAKTRRIPDEMTAVRQMEGRENRTTAGHAVNQVRPDKDVENIVSHILQGVIRTRETATADIEKEIARLRAADKGVRSPKTLFNRRQVRDLSTALKHPEKLDEAFRVADDHLRGPSHAADALTAERGLLDPEQALRSRLVPYAMAHMGATYDHAEGEFVVPGHRVQGGMRYGRTRPLPTQEILDHIKEFNDSHEDQMGDPAYVGHYPGKVAPYRFYQAYKGARGTLSGMKRTGEAFRSGGYDHTYDGLVAQAARTAEALTKSGLHDRIVNRLGIKKPLALQDPNDPTENGFWTPAEARAQAHASTHDDNENPIPGAQSLVPVTAFNPKTPLGAIAHLQSPAELDHVDGLELDALKRAQEDATSRKDANRNVVLVPHDAMDQFARQFKPAGSGVRKLGQVTQQFRRTVLPYSTHWMTQIASEGLLRSTLAGVLDPRNLVAGHQIMRELKGSEEGRNALREMVNATFYSKNDPLAKFNPNPSPTMEGLRHFPPTGAVMKAHNAYANRVGAAIGGLEHEFRVMGLGKIGRQQIQEFTRSYQLGIGLQGKNLELLTEKLKTDPALVAKFGRQVDDIFGKYNKLSPKVRSAVQTVVPFLPWYLNAAKFVLWNLPVKHPLASSLMANLRQTINQDVADGKKQPLNAFQTQALARFFPFGVFPAAPNLGSAVESATSPILPQGAGAWNVLHGENVFGDSPLYGPDGQVKPFSSATVAPAVESILESLMPGLGIARTIRQGGRTAYGTSTLLNPQTKPGTGDGILNRLFNPLHAFDSAGSAADASTAGAGSVQTGGGWRVVSPTAPAAASGGGHWKVVSGG